LIHTASGQATIGFHKLLLLGKDLPQRQHLTVRKPLRPTAQSNFSRESNCRGDMTGKAFLVKAPGVKLYCVARILDRTMTSRSGCESAKTLAM
jgi:hypothetical protein